VPPPSSSRSLGPGFRGRCSLLAWLAAVALLGSCSDDRNSGVDEQATLDYLRTLDVAALAERGSDFDHPQWAPERLGIPLEQIDTKFDFDFERLDRVRARLRGVDRQRALRGIFAAVVGRTTDHRERHLRLLLFLQRLSYHDPWLQPMHRDRAMVTDPLVLLELGGLRCGHVARVAVDLFVAAGYEARGVALDGHVVAEVHYDGDWHAFDANLFGGGGTPLHPDGSIPSIAEIAADPALLDRAPYLLEPTLGVGVLSPSMDSASSLWFQMPHRLANRVTFHKTGRPDDWQRQRGYGWEGLVSRDVEWVADAMPDRCRPGAPYLVAAEVVTDGDGRRHLRIEWQAAVDRDDDLRGHRIHIGRTTRGWHWNSFHGTDSARAAWQPASPWTPAMYDALFRPPPADIALVEVPHPDPSDPDARFAETLVPLPDDVAAIHVTVTGFDAWHEAVGATLYPGSNELRLVIPGSGAPAPPAVRE